MLFWSRLRVLLSAVSGVSQAFTHESEHDMCSKFQARAFYMLKQLREHREGR